MPGYNGTGPRGMGAMTGGGRGLCSPAGAGRALGLQRWFPPRFGSGGFAQGAYGQGRGLRRFVYEGFREPAYSQSAGNGEPMSAAEERAELQQQLGAIEDHLAQIHERLQAADK